MSDGDSETDSENGEPVALVGSQEEGKEPLNDADDGDNFLDEEENGRGTSQLFGY